jgi:hypothetical protein
LRTSLPLALLLALAPLSGCVRSLAINAAADALAGSGGSFAQDDDPEFVRDAVPFGLKLDEGLLDSAPENPKLLLAACSGFTQYAYAFLQQDAERLDEDKPAESRHLLDRCRRMYRRARRYGMRGLDTYASGFSAQFEKDRKAAHARLDRDAVPMIYWTAVAWALEISISKNDAKVLGEQPAMEALMARALALDPDWSEGAIHEFYVSYDGGRPEATGGSPKRAREHMRRALELSRGKKIGVYLSYAESVCVQEKDKKTFLAYCDKVLSFDADSAPEYRLVNLISQQRARMVKAKVDDLIPD